MEESSLEGAYHSLTVEPQKNKKKKKLSAKIVTKWPGIESHPPLLVTSTSPWKPGFDLKLANVGFIAVFSG
jgi:hypothetical protein